ncbi:MAG: sulfite exporter TauE/SafE family protein [Acidimicrobiales bacterium]
MVTLIELTMLVGVLSFISGMLGIGAALVVAPVLALFGYALKDVIQPWALLLNGSSALSGSIVFIQARMVDYRTVVPIAIICSLGAPLGVLVAERSPTTLIWWLYIATLLLVAARMLVPQTRHMESVAKIRRGARRTTTIASVPISWLSGFLGVGPGFLLVPTMMAVGFSARLAAATNSLAVVLPSFAAFGTHLSTAKLDWTTVIATCAVGIATSFVGAKFTVDKVRSRPLALVFALVMIGLALERAIVLLN